MQLIFYAFVKATWRYNDEGCDQPVGGQAPYEVNQGTDVGTKKEKIS